MTCNNVGVLQDYKIYMNIWTQYNSKLQKVWDKNKVIFGMNSKLLFPD